MLEVKGTGILPIRKFIKENFGEEGFEKWLQGLSEEARCVYNSTILATNWYPAKEVYIEPDRVMCNLFYNGSFKGSWECGRYVAEFGLKGAYKLFVKLGSPHFLVQKASTILPTYFRPAVIETGDVKEKAVSLKITLFPEMCEIVEHRIGGWMEKALEICGCKDITIDIPASLSKGDKYTEFAIKWS